MRCGDLSGTKGPRGTHLADSTITDNLCAWSRVSVRAADECAASVARNEVVGARRSDSDQAGARRTTHLMVCMAVRACPVVRKGTGEGRRARLGRRKRQPSDEAGKGGERGKRRSALVRSAAQAHPVCPSQSVRLQLVHRSPIPPVQAIAGGHLETCQPRQPTAGRLP